MTAALIPCFKSRTAPLNTKQSVCTGWDDPSYLSLIYKTIERAKVQHKIRKILF